MNEDKPSIDKEISRITGDLAYEETGSDKYLSLLNQLSALYEMKDKRRLKISGDSLMTAGVNLLGILLILNFERLNHISSKAIGFVGKLRL